MNSLLRRAGSPHALRLAIAVLLTATWFASSASSDALTLAAPFTCFHTPGFQNALDVGDVDGDSKLDVVVGGEGAIAFVALLRGAGDGTFAAAVTVGDARNPQGLKLGDLDNDGDLDVVTGGGGGYPYLSVLLGHGDGTFDPRTDYPTGPIGSSPIRAVALADFNGDGHLDAVVNDGDYALSLFLGVGDGTFAPRVRIPPVGAVNFVAAADMNEDGFADILASTNSGISVLPGHGDGTFGTSIDSPNAAFRCVTADLDGDGHLDLAGIRNPPVGQLQSSGAISFGHGDGTFGTEADYYLGLNARDLDAEDLDGDGRPDLVSANLPTNWAATVSVIRNHGDGTFEPVRTYGAPQWPRGVRLADLDGDGSPEMVVACRTAAAIGVYRGHGDATFGGGKSFVLSEWPSAPAAGDLNADGRPDIASFDYPSIRILLNDGAGGVSQAPAITSGSPDRLAISDVNGDGFGDLVSTSNHLPDYTADSTVLVRLGHGDGTFDPSSSWIVGKFPTEVLAADLDADGDVDLVVADQGESSQTPAYGLSVLIGNGDGTFQPRRATTTVREVNRFAIADFDLDGFPDLALESATSVDSVLLLWGNGDGDFSRSSLAPGGTVQGVAAGDFDGDGNTDVAVGLPASPVDRAVVLLGHGDRTFSPGSGAVETSFAGWVSRAVDLDLDGRLDLITATGWSNSVRLLRGRGDGTFEPTTFEYGLDASIGHPVILDFDGDGRPDLLEASAYTADVSIALNSSAVVTSTPELPVVVASDLALLAISPNPARGPIDITFALPAKTPATLELYDVAGRRLRAIEVGRLGSGAHRVRLDDATRLPSGIYFARLSQDGAVRTRRIAILD